MDNTAKIISFAGTCPENGELTLVSQRISSPFRTRRAIFSFPLGTDRKLLLDVYLSPDPDAPASGPPNGISMFGEYSSTSYITGDDDQKDLDHEMISPTCPSWIKVYSINIDSAPHTIDVQVEIDILERG